MKTVGFVERRVLGIIGTVVVFLLFCINFARAQASVPFTISFWYPTNSEAFSAPANIGVHALATDSNVIETMQYFSGATSIGIVTNTGGILLTNLSQDSPFYMLWSNVVAGSYTLTAVGMDSAGNMATSPPVNITVTNPVVRPSVYIYAPTNNAKFPPPANLTLYARAAESGGTVATVDFFANNVSLGVVSNSSEMVFTNVSSEPLFPFSWSNVLAGSYALKAVATDLSGISSTSSVVNITVATNSPPQPIPFNIGFLYPTNGQTYKAPAYIYLHAWVTDSNRVGEVEFFSNGSFIGMVTNNGVLLTNMSQSSPFVMTWSNVQAGVYGLTAQALDQMGNWATSAPANITVNAPTNPPPPPVPFNVGFFYPTNGQTFTAPGNVGLHARVTDSNLVESVQYFENGSFIGVVSNTGTVLFTNSTQGNPFFLDWSNVPAGPYSLTAVATDSTGLMATSAVVNITVNASTNPPPPPVPFSVGFFYPTNGQTFTAPANVGLHARVTDSNLIENVAYFENGSFIGIVTNTGTVLFTNSTQGNPFFLDWSNVPAGPYSLTAVATDSTGLMATSVVVNIAVNASTNPPPPPVPFEVGFYYPTNGQTFAAPARIGLHAWVTDSNLVEYVDYYSNGAFIGMVTNKSNTVLTNTSQTNPFFMVWSNVPAGNYLVIAVATDNAGNMATSPPVNLMVTNVPAPIIPFAVSFFYPTNGQMFAAPANIGVHARVTDSNLVDTVQYFANGTFIGIVSNTSGVFLTNSTQGNPFFLSWSNVTVGDYSLVALATDSAGNMATSAPVNISVVTDLPPVVSIYAPDPVAIEGTNCPDVFMPATCATNYVTGTNTATFLVHRNSGTNDLTVYYSVGGSATNGVDYATIPNWVTIPAGRTYALITIVPLNDYDSTYRIYDTVVLTLAPSTNAPQAYAIGSPPSAGVIILEETFLPIVQSMIRPMPDSSFHVSLPATNGMNYCLEISTDLINWLPVCTNTVMKGSAQFVDPPRGGVSPGIYYRIEQVDTPATY